LAKVLNRHFHVVQTSRITGATIPLPQMPSWLQEGQLYFYCKTSNREKNSKLREAKRKGAFENIRCTSTTNAINKYA
jgi:hypothetical protein